MKKIILFTVIIVVLMSTVSAGFINSTNHKYKIVIGGEAGNINSTSHNYTIVMDTPSDKSVSSVSHIYDFGALVEVNSLYCYVLNGVGNIISLSGSRVNLTINLNNTGPTNITCIMLPSSRACNYLATNVSNIRVPYNVSLNFTSCPVTIETNSTTGLRSIRVYVGFISSELGKAYIGAGILIIIFGYSKSEENI